jgi:hypothetical protein
MKVPFEKFGISAVDGKSYQFVVNVSPSEEEGANIAEQWNFLTDAIREKMERVNVSQASQ